MSVSVPRVCPECGSDTYFAQHFPRVRDKVDMLEARIRKMAAEFAVREANWELERIERAEQSKFLAGKAHRQRLVINRLEKKLRALGQRPHEPDVAEGAVPVE